MIEPKDNKLEESFVAIANGDESVPTSPRKSGVSDVKQHSNALQTSNGEARRKGTWSDRLTSKKLKEIIAVMRDPNRGIKLQEVTYRWRHYPHCFSGRAFVDWVMSSIKGWEGRDEAIKLGQLMMGKGIFKGVNSKAASSSTLLDDAYSYYTFQVDDFITQLNSRTMHEVVGKMRNEKYGIQVKDRKYLLQTYPKSFIGSEAVDWLVEHVFIKTRKEAVEFGQILMNNGFIYHATQKLPFCDGYQFYCFEEEKMHKRGYLNYKECGTTVNYNKTIRSPEFNNYVPDDQDDWTEILPDSVGCGRTREKLHSSEFKLFWCCLKGATLWCYLSPRSPQPFTSIRLSDGIVMKVVHVQCGSPDCALSDKCRFEIVTCHEGKQYCMIPKTCKKMAKWVEVLYEYSVQAENDLMLQAEQIICKAMLDKHRRWMKMKKMEKNSGPDKHK